ncbi:MAG TPA: response regulator, partial [Anaerolineae bacterium]|nr:response regulator [Anaerolineae bacterium]
MSKTSRLVAQLEFALPTQSPSPQPINKPFDTALRPKRNLTHILVVDDEPLIAQSIADLLTLANAYTVTIAAGGRDALTKIEATVATALHPFDLVLLDIDMPMVSGLDVLKWIRQHPRLSSMRVLMLTGIADKRDMINALSEGADDYITKPYHPQELLARIKTTLRTQQLEKQLARQSSQLAMLNTITNTITKRLELKELLQASVNGVRELLEVAVTAVFMQDSFDRKRLRCQHLKADRGVVLTPADYASIPIGRGVISKAFTQRTTHCVNEAITDTRFDPTVDAPKGYRINNIMTASIYMRGHPIGVLVAINKRHGTFEESDADLFVSLAGTMSQALENTYLFSSVQTRQIELLENRNALQSIIDGIQHPIYTINKRYEIVSSNAQANTFASPTASKDETRVGKVCYETFFKRNTPCKECQVATLLSSAQQTHWSIRQMREDYFPVEWDIGAHPMAGKKEDAPVAVVVWQDRTEEKRLENSLHRAAKLSAVGQLAAGVAHEINNPLTVIKTGAEMLKDVITPEMGDDYELVEWINNATDRATKVVRGLLDFARQSSYNFQLGQVKTSIESTIELVAYQMRKGNVEIVREYGEDVPQVMASWEHLKTVWLNILLNAR